MVDRFCHTTIVECFVENPCFVDLQTFPAKACLVTMAHFKALESIENRLEFLRIPSIIGAAYYSLVRLISSTTTATAA